MLNITIFLILRLISICIISAVLGVSGITATTWQFWVIMFCVIATGTCDYFISNSQYSSNKNNEDISQDTCASCEYLSYNSDGSTECQLEWEHKCRPETRVMYKNKFK